MKIIRIFVLKGIEVVKLKLLNFDIEYIKNVVAPDTGFEPVTK